MYLIIYKSFFIKSFMRSLINFFLLKRSIDSYINFLHYLNIFVITHFS